MKNKTLEERVKLTITLCSQNIICAENQMKLAELREQDDKWLHNHELVQLNQMIIDMLNGDYDLTI